MNFLIDEVVLKGKDANNTISYVHYFFERHGLGETLGSLSKRSFETPTATGREHFACKDGIISQSFILLISK